MQTVKGLTKLELTAGFTLALIFGVIAGILGIALWFSGVSGFAGILSAFLLTLLLMGIQWWFGPTLIKWFTRMREIAPNEHPWLHEMVEEMSREAGIPKPKLYIVYDGSPNAFAFGRTQSDAGISVHTGLLNLLNKNEIKAVIAHEIGHIKHRDVIVMTIASVLPVLLYYLVLVLGRGDERERSFSQAMLVFFGALLARIFGQLLVLWLSRVREYYADAFSAYITRNPKALMNGLVKITYGLNRLTMQGYNVNPSMKAFYVGEPSTENIAEIAQAISKGDKELEMALEVEKEKAPLEWFSTHPLTVNRLLALNKIRKELKES